jgi:hypothetical protein
VDPYTCKIDRALQHGSQAAHFHRRYQRLPSGLIVVRTKIDGGSPRVLLPNVSAVTTPILQHLHDSPLSGHTGADSTYRRMRARFYAQGLSNIVDRYVASCPTCRENRSLAHPPYGMAAPLEIPTLPGADLSTDFTFCLPRSVCPTSQCVYTGIQVYVDRLSKRVLLLPCSSDITAEGAADLYLQRVLPIFGMMRSLVSDRDPRFTSAFWKQLCQVLQVQLKMSTPRHPQTDGQSEEAIRWIKQILRAFCNDRQDDWVAMLPMVELCINTTPTQSRNGHTPMQVFQGFNPLVPADFLIPTSLQAATTAAKDRLAFHQQALVAARDAIQAAQDVSAAAFNKGRVDAPFKAGDWVRVKASHLVPPGERDDEVKITLRRKWPGPFLIKRAVGQNAFELDPPRILPQGTSCV